MTTPRGIRTIMLIEDDASMRARLREALVRDRFAVLEAPDASTALRLMSVTSPDLIIQELGLRDTDAFELARKLRLSAIGRSIPILGLAGIFSGPDPADTDAGFAAMLLKPIQAENLLATVHDLLDQADGRVHRRGDGRRILIVDDDTALLKLLRIQLVDDGFVVDTATDGANALAQARTANPHAIISDLCMPGLDGFSLCRAIRADPVLSRVPVMLMSSKFMEQADRDMAIAVGATLMVAKTPGMDMIVPLVAALSVTVDRQAPIGDGDAEVSRMASLAHQVKRQVAVNSELSQQNQVQSSLLAMFRSLSDAIMTAEEGEDPIRAVFSTCLETAGIEMGALFLGETEGRLVMSKGMPATSEGIVADFLGHPWCAGSSRADEPMALSSGDCGRFQPLLDAAVATTGLLVPLVANNQRLGAMFFGSNHGCFSDESRLVFARMIAAQVAQAARISEMLGGLVLSERRHRALMEHASCGIFIEDLHGVISDVNETAQRILGRPRQAFIGHQFSEFIHPKDVDACRERFRQLIVDRQPAVGETGMTLPDGTEVRIEFNIAVIDLEGTTFVIAVLTDVTERNELRRQAHLDDRLRTVGTLAAGIAHEVNNPAAFMLANLEYLRDRIAKVHASISSRVAEGAAPGGAWETELDPFLSEMDRVIAETMEGGARIRDIVLGLKTFARSEDAAPSVSSIEIGGVLDAAIGMASHEIRNRASLVKDYGEALPQICGGSGRIGQVFVNLLVNAAQAMGEADPDRNAIRVRTRLEGPYVRVDVSDTGPGIAADDLPRIFDPFFTTKPAGVGTGLGLSICHEIVRELGGKLRVETVVGEGTTFTVLLPLSSNVPAPAVAPAAVEKTPAKKRLRVLMVDDEPYVLKAFERLFGRRYLLTLAPNGRAALEILAKNHGKFDAILSDLSMPEVDGMDLHRFVAEHYPELAERMIFMTGGAFTDAARAFLESVGSRRLEKPFDSEQACRVIDDVCAAAPGTAAVRLAHATMSA